MVNSKKKSKLTAQQTLSILMAAVNGFNSIAPLTLPLAAITAESVPLHQHRITQDALFTQLNKSGQMLDKLLFSTAYAYTPDVNAGMTVTAETLDQTTDMQTIHSGGTATSTTLNNGAQVINSGGSAISTIINTEGQQLIETGGVAASAIINSGGVQLANSGGLAVSTTIEESGFQAIGNSGTAIETTILNGGLQVISGGLAVSTSILSGGIQNLNDGTATNTIINDGGMQNVYDNAISTTVSYGGVQNVNYQGSATSTTINSGGLQLINFSGTATSATINSGGTQIVQSGGTATSTTINSGGSQSVSGGLATSTSILDGGIQQVASFGSATFTTIENGGIQNVNYSGSTTSTTINSGGLQFIDGGMAISTTINEGGTQAVSSGGSAVFTTINNAGTQSVHGDATSTTINSGGTQAVRSGGTAMQTIINNGGLQIVSTGTAESTTINSGGNQYVTAHGNVVSTTVNSGGIQDIRNSGTASSTIITSGGMQNINSGGSATSATINQGGVQIVTQFGNVTSTTINSGGIQYLENNAEANFNIVVAGGTVALRSEGNAWLYDMQINGGTIQLATTGTIGNNVTLSNPQGSANFVINTDLANNQSDHITIEGGSTTNTVKVNYDPGFGQGPSISGSARFATVTDETTTFTGVATDSGAYRYTPIISSVQVSNNEHSRSVREDYVEWYITGLSSGGASETMYTAHDAVANTLTLWRDENNHLIRRMGDLRTGSGQTGDWARVYSGEQESNSSNGRHTTQKYTALQGGHDTKHASDSGTRFTGYTIGYLNADATMERGTGDASSISIGAYSSWFGNKGHFLDLILKQGRLRNSFTSYLENADNTRVDASYNNWGTSLSAEYGWRKPLNNQWYLEPQAEITVNRITSADFTASDGTSVSQGGLNSVIGRLGVMVGKTVKQNSFYLQASLLREFNAHSDVTMSSGGNPPVTMREDLKETYMEFALGITTAFNDKTSGYFEASKTTGDKVRTPWLLNAGFRRNF